MRQVAGHGFPMTLLTRAEKKDEFFDDVGTSWAESTLWEIARPGNLLREPHLPPFDLKQDLLDNNVPAEHAGPAAAFLQACFNLDPAKRPTAQACASGPYLLYANSLQDFIPPR
jgi:hypothetical protein